MPYGDGTGPQGMGPMTGRGLGGRGRGRGMGRGGSSYCVCPNCSQKVPHNRSVPCAQMQCPNCGGPMAGDYCAPGTIPPRGGM